MNYYERHLGDYARDTGHLSLLEHGVYTVLIDRYYASEQGIPEDKAYRLARARTDDEREAVDAVLDEFFELVDGVWLHHRVEAEIERYTAKQAEVGEKRENENDRQKRHRQRRKSMFAQLRSHGVVMPWDTPTHELETHLSRVTGGDGHAPVTRTDTATQTPDTSNQYSIGNASTHTQGTERASARGVCDEPRPEVIAAKALRDHGLRVTPSHPDLIAAMGEGVTPEDLIDMASLYPDKPAGYVIAACRRQHAESANPPPGASHETCRPGRETGRKLTPAERVVANIHRRRGAGQDGDCTGSDGSAVGPDGVPIRPPLVQPVR